MEIILEIKTRMFDALITSKFDLFIVIFFYLLGKPSLHSFAYSCTGRIWILHICAYACTLECNVILNASKIKAGLNKFRQIKQWKIKDVVDNF